MTPTETASIHWSDPAILAALVAGLTALVATLVGTWINLKISNDQRKARLADFENENLRELRGHIAIFLDATTRKLMASDKLTRIGPEELSPTSHQSVIDEFIKAANDRDLAYSSQGNSYEQIRLMLVEQTEDNVALVNALKQAVDAEMAAEISGLSIIAKARQVISNKISEIREQL